MMQASAGDPPMELVLFRCGELLCGVDVRQVQEITRLLEITRVHHAPEHVKGVLNLRGQLLTVLDLRVMFQMVPAPGADTMRIVVVKGEQGIVGLVVDQVIDIVEAGQEEMEPPPSHIDDVPGSFFRAIYKREAELVAVLDLGQVLSHSRR